MRALALVLGASLLWSTAVLADSPCDPPRIRDVKPLMKATREDRTVIDGYMKAIEVCKRPGDACDEARLACSATLTNVLNAQVNFDEGWWLRDMVLPYLGQQYQTAQPISIPNPLSDVSCNLDLAQLQEAAQRRAVQVERRAAILDEYPRYVKWANEAYKRCTDAAAADQSRQAMQRSEAERLALAAATAKAAEEKRLRELSDAKRRAEDEERKKKDAEAEAVRKQQEAAAKAQRAQEDEAARQRRLQAEAAAKAKAEKDRAEWEAQEKARIAAEEQQVKQREADKDRARREKEALLAQAEEEVGMTQDEIARRRKETLARLDAEDAAAAEVARKKLELAKKKAEGIKVDDSDERPRGELALLGGIGYGGLSQGASQGQGLLLGGEALLHFGIWGTAPVQGMASGFEVRLLARFLQSVTLGNLQTFDGQLTARYFFGHVGVGLAGEFRSFMSEVNTSTAAPATCAGDCRRFTTFELGPSIGLAMADTPHLRALLNVTWLPVGTHPGTVDWARVVADFEVSWEWFVFDLAGGTLTDVTQGAPPRLGFFVAASFGVRLHW